MFFPVNENDVFIDLMKSFVLSMLQRWLSCGYNGIQHQKLHLISISIGQYYTMSTKKLSQIIFSIIIVKPGEIL